MTLLRNQNNVLPLSAASKVVVTGPSADSMTNQLGGWSVSWQGVFGAGHVCCMGPANQIPPGTTVLKGLQAADPNAVFAPDQATALADAASADAVVVAVGEKAYAEGLGDNPAPALPPDQQSPDQRPGGDRQAGDRRRDRRPAVGLGPAENADGVLMAYQGSTEAGTAVADAIFGKIDPSGKLPVSWPSDAAAPGGDFDSTAPSPLGDQPKVFDQLPGTGSGPGRGYNPLYPFGFGLSYTTFDDQRALRDQQRVPQRHGDRHLHCGQHRQPGGHRHRAGVCPPAGQRGAGPGPAAGRASPGSRWPPAVQDRSGLLPGVGPRRDPG